MNFQNPIIHLQRFQISPKSGKINQNFKILYVCKNLTESSQKLILFIYLLEIS